MMTFRPFRMIPALAAAICLITALTGAAPKKPVQTIKSIVPDFIGEFRAIAGHVTEYIPPPEPRAPHAFIMKDITGDPMRIVIWPDIFERIDNHEALKSAGTSVTLTAEVVEYNDKIEMHMGDWEEIEVEPAPTSVADASTTPVAVTTSSTAVTSTTH